MAPDVMAATMDSGLIPGLSGLPVAGSLDFALLGLQGKYAHIVIVEIPLQVGKVCSRLLLVVMLLLL